MCVCEPVLSVWGSWSCCSWDLLGAHGAPCQSQARPFPCSAGSGEPGKGSEWDAIPAFSSFSRQECTGQCIQQVLRGGRSGELNPFCIILILMSFCHQLLVGCSDVSRDGKAGMQEMQEIPFLPSLEAQQSRRLLPAPSPGAICSQVTLLLSHLSQALLLNQLGLFPSLIPAAKLLFSIWISNLFMASFYTMNSYPFI